MLISLISGQLPAWIDYWIQSASYAHKRGVSFLILAMDKSRAPTIQAPNVFIKHVTTTTIAKKVADAMNANGYSNGNGQGREHLYSDLERESLRVLYGAMFKDLLDEYTHWGWIDMGVLVGDLSPLVAAAQKFDVVTYPDPVCHF